MHASKLGREPPQQAIAVSCRNQQAASDAHPPELSIENVNTCSAAHINSQFCLHPRTQATFVTTRSKRDSSISAARFSHSRPKLLADASQQHQPTFSRQRVCCPRLTSPMHISGQIRTEQAKQSALAQSSQLQRQPCTASQPQRQLYRIMTMRILQQAMQFSCLTVSFFSTIEFCQRVRDTVSKRSQECEPAFMSHPIVRESCPMLVTESRRRTSQWFGAF